MNRETYESVELKISEFDAEDVIMTSEPLNPDEYEIIGGGAGG